MPDHDRGLDAYMHDMLTGDDLFITDKARELAVRIVLKPPVPLPARPLLELANQITVGLLPSKIRRATGCGGIPCAAWPSTAGRST
jgi:uncharacterized protein (DUF2236 family)